MSFSLAFQIYLEWAWEGVLKEREPSWDVFTVAWSPLAGPLWHRHLSRWIHLCLQCGLMSCWPCGWPLHCHPYCSALPAFLVLNAEGVVSVCSGCSVQGCCGDSHLLSSTGIGRGPAETSMETSGWTIRMPALSWKKLLKGGKKSMTWFSIVHLSPDKELQQYNSEIDIGILFIFEVIDSIKSMSSS